MPDRKTELYWHGMSLEKRFADSQFICAKCQAIVLVPRHMVLSPGQEVALNLGVCRDCLGTREVKEL